jgi:FixJ family two-component response regulator
MDKTPVVFLLDDDPSVLVALTRLLECSGIAVQAWNSANRFLCEHDPSSPGCLVSDIVMPDMNGLELQAALQGTDSERPIIFITGHGSIPLSVRAMKAGAITFLPKPVRASELLTAVKEAISHDAGARSNRARRGAILRRLETLTPRERQVIELVAKGMLNKQIAGILGAAEKTIKVHRGRAMEKLQVSSAATLVGLLSDAMGSNINPVSIPLPVTSDAAIGLSDFGAPGGHPVELAQLGLVL